MFTAGPIIRLFCADPNMMSYLASPLGKKHMQIPVFFWICNVSCVFVINE